MHNRVLQNIFSAYSGYLSKTAQPLKNLKAISSIQECRTKAMGSSYYRCKHNHVTEQYHSCRHRSCPLCSGRKQLQWVDQQRRKLFDTEHFHVVFTIPHEYLQLWQYNEERLTDILFLSSKETLFELMASKAYHGVTPGMLMALHTWGRQLTLHPHIHCLITAGGLTLRENWKETGEYLLPVRVVKSLYRGKFQALLLEQYRAGLLKLPPNWSIGQFDILFKACYRKEWSVRIQERYEHGRGVLLYFSRYIKGGPLKPKQILNVDHKGLKFRYFDHRDQRRKQLRLKPLEFLRRILQHIPPIGKHMVRGYGLYAGCNKKKHDLCSNLVGLMKDQPLPAGLQIQDLVVECGQCHEPTKLSGRVWSKAKKGISFIKGVARQDSAGGNVQHGDEPDTAGMGLFSSA
ncbi:transposase [Microbulbifer sp. THAF38]|uniref:IS91 family transposase n=1 Tax=Microbulbifer sp. THAF38 TaxID=2587856 RepID=UPI001268FE7F|nr:transposase [Microbulbifer sp. THAF38]QFT54207.1 Putative transposase [Microbulbifer sp. THAF38]